MNYAKYENGALHISATAKPGYKPLTVQKPDGFDNCKFTGYEETDTEIIMNYEASVPAADNTLQRISELEQRMELTEGAVQEILIGEVSDDESKVSGSENP